MQKQTATQRFINSLTDEEAPLVWFWTLHDVGSCDDYAFLQKDIPVTHYKERLFAIEVLIQMYIPRYRKTIQDMREHPGKHVYMTVYI